VQHTIGRVATAAGIGKQRSRRWPHRAPMVVKNERINADFWGGAVLRRQLVFFKKKTGAPHDRWQYFMGSAVNNERH